MRQTHRNPPGNWYRRLHINNIPMVWKPYALVPLVFATPITLGEFKGRRITPPRRVSAHYRNLITGIIFTWCRKSDEVVIVRSFGICNPMRFAKTLKWRYVMISTQHSQSHLKIPRPRRSASRPTEDVREANAL